MGTLRRTTISKFVVITALSFALTPLLSGCAVSSTPTTSLTPSPTQTQLTDAQALIEFTTIVDASIAKANQFGLTQTTVNSDFGTYVLVTDNSSSAYQATVKNADGTFALLAEADAFTPWAAKAWLQLGATVSFEGGRFVLTRDIEATPTDYVFEVSNGLLLTESGQSAQSTWVSTLSYQVSTEGFEILKIGATLTR
jgi:hypothetical protein